MSNKPIRYFIGCHTKVYKENMYKNHYLNAINVGYVMFFIAILFFGVSGRRGRGTSAGIRTHFGSIFGPKMANF